MLYDFLGLLLLCAALAPWTAMLLGEVRACRREDEPYAVIPYSLWDGYGTGLYYWTAATFGALLLALLFLSVE